MNDSFLSADDLGMMLGITGKTVRAWHSEGRIPASVSEGKVLRFSVSAVRRALAKRAASNHRPDLSKLTVPTY